jgi:hypothetical protein
VLLDEKGEPLVADFGLARRVEGGSDLTRPGAIVGTPSYMAPEQARGEKGLTAAVDIYSLGAILYELLTGLPPFRAATPLDTILQVLELDPVAPSKLDARVDLDLETICLKCLDKEPHKRYASARALAQDLDRFLEGNPVSARRLGEWESAMRWAKKHPITAALTGLLGIGLLLAQVLYAAMSFIPGFVFVNDNSRADKESSILGLAFAAWVAGFLATMAIRVRPRRRVVSGVSLYLLITLGLPYAMHEYLTAGDRPGASHLFVVLGLGVGVLLAAVYGGMSHSIARRHQSDMLTAFFGGVPGAICLMVCFGCLSSVLAFLLFRGRDFGDVNDDGTSKVLILLPICLLMFIGSLVGFWWSGTFVARFVQHRTAHADTMSASEPGGVKT